MTQAAQPTPHVAKTETSTMFDERLFDAKLEAVEARTETKFAQLLGEIKLLAVGIGNLSAEIGTVRTDIGEAKSAAASGKTYVIGTGIALGGFILGVFAFGWQILEVATALFQTGRGG